MSLSFCSSSSAEASTAVVPSTVSTGGVSFAVEYARGKAALDRRSAGVDRVERIAVRKSEIDPDIIWFEARSAIGFLLTLLAGQSHCHFV